MQFLPQAAFMCIICFLLLFLTFFPSHSAGAAPSSPSLALSLSSPHIPPSSSVPWLIRPGYQAVSTECPFVDYSPRNHVAQLNYSWLQRLHLLLRHLEDALLNQPIAATTSMIPAHKESLLGYPCCPWGPTANAGFLSVPGDVLWEYNTCMRELCRGPRDCVTAIIIFTVIRSLHIQWWISGVF